MSSIPTTPGAHPVDVAHEGDHGHDHPPHLAHHFDTPVQQYASGKLGMWVFLGTEILMFGGLFVAYAVYRFNHPEVFLYAHHSLNKTLGFINTMVLITSSLTMAMAVRYIQLGNRKATIVCLLLTLMGGFGFMGIKSVEYYQKISHGTFVGQWNRYDKRWVDTHGAENAHASGEAEGSGEHAAGSADDHEAAEGAEHGGPDLDTSAYRVAVDPDAPTNSGTGMDADEATEMAAETGPDVLASYGEAYLDPHAFTGDGDAATIRPSFADPKGTALERPLLVANVVGRQQGEPTLGNVDNAHASGNPAEHDVAGHGAPGEHAGVEFGDLSTADQHNVNTFYSIYFAMTGLHGLHVLIGMGLITWVTIKTSAGTFSPAYFTPVDLVGLYWHLVDLIWIFLFPLLYLIH